MLDTPVDLIMSTVQIDQAAEDGRRVVGTGFLVTAANADGSPRTLLITADHVLTDMKASEARIGFRSQDATGAWTFTPARIAIRDEAGHPLWTKHPTYDVAAMSITAPPEFARAAIPLNYLAADAAAEQAVRAGDELLVLGYPRGLAANGAGFPILRAGRVASYPIAPSRSPTFLLDFSVFPGNSGGPVFITSQLHKTPMIAGMLIQQVELEKERLELGIVIHARYIAETIDLQFGGKAAAPAPASPPELIPASTPASYAVEPSGWRGFVVRVRKVVASTLGDALDGAGRAMHQMAAWLRGGPEASLKEL